MVKEPLKSLELSVRIFLKKEKSSYGYNEKDNLVDSIKNYVFTKHKMCIDTRNCRN